MSPLARPARRRQARGRGLILVILAFPLLVASCGDRKAASPTTTTAGSPRVELADGTAKTVAAGSARFALAVSGAVAGMSADSQERGTISFARRAGHLFRLVPGSGVPQEMIIDGPIVYTNANVEAALSDPSVRPWTRLDTRLLPAANKQGPDDIDHVRALAYLADGVVHPRRVAPTTGNSTGVTHFRGLVVPSRVVAHVPARERKTIREVVAADYADHPFPADFWLDGKGRIIRVVVAYRTQGGGAIRLTGRFSAFGSRVDLALPPASGIQDITP